MWHKALILFLSVVMITGCLSEQGTSEGFEGRELDGEPAPQFNLTTHDNTSLNLSDLNGKIVALTFLYTSCPDVCPLITSYMQEAQLELTPSEATKVEFMAITVDPMTDTPEKLKHFRMQRSLDWPFLTGHYMHLKPIYDAYGVAVEYPANLTYYHGQNMSHDGNNSHGRGDGHNESQNNETHNNETGDNSTHNGHAGHEGYLVGHTAVVYLIDVEGRMRVMFPGLPPKAWDSPELAHDIRLLLEEAS